MILHLDPSYQKDYLPIRGRGQRDWWEAEHLTSNHARHCHPLVMANTWGWDILSPCGFVANHDGLRITDGHGNVDMHSARQSFTLQADFVPRTESVGDFVWIGALPNQRREVERRNSFVAMEAMIEAWWNPAPFGLVCLFDGEVEIEKGQPIARMRVVNVPHNHPTFETSDERHPEWQAWNERRNRPGFSKDLDYMKGLHPDGSKEETHYRSWR